MRIAALDSSTRWAGLALLDCDPSGPIRVVAESGFEVVQSHASHLPRALGQLLSLVGWDRADVDGYVVTRGPGSFTGIRVGLGTVRGLALAADRPCAAVMTLDALVRAHGPTDRPALAVISAGRGEFYGALYEVGAESSHPVDGPWVDGLLRLRTVAAASGAIVIPAPGTLALLGETDLRGVRLAEPPRTIAAAAGRVAWSRGAFSRTTDPGLSPLYLRPPDAELPRVG